MYNPTMNWKTIICRIQRRGKLTETEIAKKVKTSQQNINILKKSPKADPRWTLGNALIELDEKIKE